jgi:SAM-dependent methyltransferase
VELALKLGIDPLNPWVGDYVEYEWAHLRKILFGYGISVEGRNVLEFGCNYGASAIVLHHLGAQVVAVDIDSVAVELATLNAERYRADTVTFRTIDPKAPLPLKEEWADLVVCNSVFEYVESRQLRETVRKIDRVLRPGGILLITGTSNRLWPREVHTGRWIVNYWPRFFDHFTGWSPVRGVHPLTLRCALGHHYRNMDLDDDGKAWLRIRAAFARTAVPSRAATACVILAHMIGVGPGWIAPHISAVMVKTF